MIKIGLASIVSRMVDNQTHWNLDQENNKYVKNPLPHKTLRLHKVLRDFKAS